MPKSSISPDTLRLIETDWFGADRGQKSCIIQGWASKLGVSGQTIYRQLQTRRKREADRGKRRIEGIEEAAMAVCKIKKMSPEHKGDICTEDAVALAVSNGLITPEMGAKKATIDRIIREKGAARGKRRRISRYQAELPNEMHHVDASSSECLYVATVTNSGDVVCRLWKGHKIYKNKPAPVRLRPWVYGLTDDYSGVHVARYCAAMGESASDNLDFLAWAWAKNDDKEFFGLPGKLKGDKGPMLRGPAAQNFFDRLGIDIDPSIPGAKEAHGKIERPWRTMWERFERPFFVEDPKTFEITLDEVNRRFYRYQVEYNQKPHRYERRLSRIEAWRRVNQAGGAVDFPAGALATVARRYERTVGQDGVFHIDNVPYEVIGLHDAKVYVYIGMDEHMVVEDQATGEKYNVKDFRPNPLGVFRSAPDTGSQRARKDAEIELRGHLHNTLYTEVTAENVTRFPVRAAAAPEIASVFEVPTPGDTYSSLADAITDFCSMTGCFLESGSDDRAAVEGMILDSGLNREYVRGLADDVNNENERRANG